MQNSNLKQTDECIYFMNFCFGNNVQKMYTSSKEVCTLELFNSQSLTFIPDLTSSLIFFFVNKKYMEENVHVNGNYVQGKVFYFNF